VSRLRTIKPGFFFDDQLSECDPLARLLYAGMWTIADREGRLEDRPKRIKAECLPFDDCDVDVLLDQLERRGFITRYTAGEARYIAIPTWAKHPHPHVKEPASVIPAPDEYQLSMSLANVEPGSSCLVSCLGSCLGDSEQEEHLSTTATVPAAETYSPDFEQWWEAYGRHGSKADAAKLWKHWRKQASPEALLTAARNYVSDCMARDRLIRDGRTFLARDPNRWAEWIEPHPADVATDRRTVGNLTDVLDAGARAFGLIGDDHGIPGTGVADRPDGAVAGRADARRGLPSGELAAGQ
jgi:hypothetical protein